MGRISVFLRRELSNFTLNEYITMFVMCSILLPFKFPLLTIAGVLLYLCATGRTEGIIRAAPKSGFMIVFCLLASTITFISGNLLGGVCGIEILLLMLFVFYFRTVINKRSFELLMDACCIISLFCFGWVVIEYCRIIVRLSYSFLQLKMESSPKDHINLTFLSANYYTMVIEFTVLICVYRMMQVKALHRIVFYIVIIVCNLFALYLSGSRITQIPFVVTIPFIFSINGRLIYLATSMAGIGGAGMLLPLGSRPMQRTAVFQDFTKHDNIWETAVKGIQVHLLLGKGPLIYFHTYKQHHGHPTRHTHSIYLDPILNHGIIGVILVGICFADNLKEVYLLLRRKIDLRLFSLISAFILTILIHGILDYTVYRVQTGLLFLMVLSASDMYFHKEQPYDIQGEH